MPNDIAPFITKEQSEILQHEALLAEQQDSLTQKQLEILYKQKLFKLFVPKVFGGLELSLLEGLQAEEALAKIDGSLGWTVTLCSGATFFIGYLSKDLSTPIFADDKVCFGGSGAATGVAKKMQEGYKVTGFWKYATGTPYNTIFTANCLVEENGTLLLNEDNTPLIRSFLFYKEEIIIHPTWKMMGLKATASHSFEVKNCFVNDNRSFVISGETATLHQSIYQYPFLQFAEATIAVITLGMVEHFLEECKTILATQWQPANIELQEIRSRFYEVVTSSWKAHIQNEKDKQKAFEEVSKISRMMVNKARLIVSQLYPLCGMTAANEQSTINRIWRDLFTASQHNLLT